MKWSSTTPDLGSWVGGYRVWTQSQNYVDLFGVEDVTVTFTKN
jgi:hypothetical protein